MTQDEALRKAMSCLRLSKSNNAHEAALAAAKAQEIITAYKLDVTGLDYEQQDKQRDDEPIQDFGQDPIDEMLTSNYAFKWMAALSSAIARHNQCRQYRSLNHGGKGGRTMIVGRPSDVQTVRYIYSYLKGEVLRLRAEHTKGNGDRYKFEFCLGVVDAIRAKLVEQEKASFDTARATQLANPLALIRVNNAIEKIQKRDQAVEKWIEANMTYLSNGRGGAGVSNIAGGRPHGQQVGQSIRMTSARAGIGSGTRQIGGAK